MNQDSGLDAAFLGDRPEARLERLAIERFERGNACAECVQVLVNAGRRQVLLDGGGIELDAIVKKGTQLREEIAEPPP